MIFSAKKRIVLVVSFGCVSQACASLNLIIPAGGDINPAAFDGTPDGGYIEQLLFNDVPISGTSGSPQNLNVSYNLISDGHGASIDYSAAGSRLSAPVAADLGLSIVGTGNVDILARQGFNGGDRSYGGLGFLINSGAISSVSFSIDYNQDIFARQFGLVTAAPLAGIVRSTTGTGAMDEQWNVSYSFVDSTGGVVNYGNTSTYLGGAGDTVVQGLVPSQNSNLTTLNGVTTGTLDGAATVGVIDFNDGDDSDDVIRGVRVTLTPAGGLASFSEGTQFNFSVDGKNETLVFEAPINFLRPLLPFVR